jgi:hypothetical protein
VNEPKRNACRVVDSVDGGEGVDYVWTLSDGRGLWHGHGEDGCPFEPGGRWAGEAEQAAQEVMGEDPSCHLCGEVHEGGHE